MGLNTSDNSIYLSEAGLYQLTLRSNKPAAKEFTKWLAKEALPSIRLTGTYTTPDSERNIFLLRNEKDLHYHVIRFVKKHFPDVILLPGLGELQRTSNLRLQSFNKGYRSGQPDIIILNLHKQILRAGSGAKESNYRGNTIS